MFTGIVECVAAIDGTQAVPGGRRLRVAAPSIADDCALGASVCVSGVCLTVAGRAGSALEFDVITETLERSTLGALRKGDRVNLERSLAVGDRLDGHFVQGHVDGTGTVTRVDTSGGQHCVWLRASSELLPYVIPKGSIAIDGVSLTIASLRSGEFSVALIPTTLDQTTLSSLTPGRRVNIETDVITRTIVHRMSMLEGAHGVSLSALRQAGLA